MRSVSDIAAEIRQLRERIRELEAEAALSAKAQMAIYEYERRQVQGSRWCEHE